MGKGLSFGRLLYDFSLWCTIACLNKIVTSTKWIAVAFTIIFLAMCFLFVFISTNCTLKFFKFPSSTEVSIDMKSTPFPRFSFCNENPMKRSIVNNDGPYAEIASLLRQYELIEQNQTSRDDYGLGSTTSRLQRMHRARLMLRLLMAKLSDADRMAAGYSFTELVTECTFAGVTCTSADFTPFLHPEYGVCYTFNGERMVAKAGKMEGLRMLMTVNQDSPLEGIFDFLPTTDSATVWGVIYDVADYPDFMKGGFRVGASTQSFVALSKSAHARMEKPYGNCTNDGSSASEYYGNVTYTLQLCQNACLQRLAAERCGCVDPLYPKTANETFCTTGANMLCLISLTNDVSAATSPGGKTMCGCRAPCNDVVYDKTITNSIFPSENYKVATGTQAQRGVLLEEQNGGRTGGGSDDSDDYDNPATTTTARAATQGTTMTSGSGSIGTTAGSGVVTGGSTTTPILSVLTSTTTAPSGSAGSTTTPIFSALTSTTTSRTTTTTHSSHEVTSADARSSSTPTPSTATTSTTGTPMTTTTAQQCSYKGPPVTAPITLPAWCRLKFEIFNDPNIIAIQGYPCTSTKTCNTCVFFSAPPSPDSFICSYSYPPGGCTDKDNTGYLPSSSAYTKCSAFFGAFDFIPTGTNVPNISNWWTAALPSSYTPCYSDPNQGNCWNNTVCKTNPSSADLSTLKNVPNIPLDSAFLAKLTSTTTPCQMATLALQMATDKYNPLNNLGKRKKRDTSSSTSGTVLNSTSNSTVDVPGWGSCEYANKNFNGAQACIEWYARNGLMMHIYFETLEVQSYTQGATYPLVALISDISGHAGLWLGMSVVSVVELIALVFMCFNTLFCGRKINLPNKDEIKKEMDERERGRPGATDSARSE